MEVLVVYYERSGRRINRPLEPRTPPVEVDPDDPKVQYILKVAEQYPKFTPEEVYIEIRYVRRRNDITRALVRSVLAKKPRTFSP